MEITVDSTSLKIIGGLLVTTIGSLVGATVTLVRRYHRIEELELTVLGDPAQARKGLRRLILGDPETGELGLLSLHKRVDRHEKVVDAVLRGFDILDEDHIAEVIRAKTKNTPTVPPPRAATSHSSEG